MNSSDSSSKSTPSKAGVNGLFNQKRDNMMPALWADIQDFIYKDVTLKLFIEHIWGLPPETITKLLSADWTLDEMAFAQYKNVLDPSNTLREPDLHAPFCAIASKLVLDAHIVLGILAANLVEHFWDGNGTTILSRKYTKRKPDLLSLWGPVPNWAKMRSALEFKIETIPNNAESSVSLPVISEDLLLPKPDRTPRHPQEISNNRRVKKQKDPGHHSQAATISTERTSRISSQTQVPLVSTTTPPLLLALRASSSGGLLKMTMTLCLWLLP